MAKLIELLKRHKKITIIVTLIIFLVAILLLAFGGTTKSFTVNSSVRSESEEKLVRILTEINGVGKAEVMITENADGTVEGVVVVCEGANDIMTRNDVINAVKTALKLEKNNIAVYAMN